MPPWKAATPGALVCIAATVLLVLVTVSTPITRTFYFLQVNIAASSTRGNISGRGALELGVFGYCAADACTPTTLGYDLSTSTLGLGTSQISQIAGLSNSVIKGLTYVLILHPIAAGLAGIASILGLIGHVREMAPLCIVSATWIAGLGSTISLLAFIFDIVVFTIAKNRIGSTNASNANVTVNTGASYGNAIWMTLAAFILLAVSGCCFKFGTNVARVARGQKRQRTPADDHYAFEARRDALEAEKLRASQAYGNGGGSKSSLHEKGLPSFAEPRTETVPLRSAMYDGQDDEERRMPGGPYDADPFERQSIAGVGAGYGRRLPNISTASATPPRGPAAATDEHGRSPNQVEPFQSMYSGTPHPYSSGPTSAGPPRSPSPPIPVAPLPHDGSAYPSYSPSADPYAAAADHVRATSPRAGQPIHLQPYTDSFSSSLNEAHGSPSPSYGAYSPAAAKPSAVPFVSPQHQQSTAYAPPLPQPQPQQGYASSIAPTYMTSEPPRDVHASYYQAPPPNQYGQRWQ